MSQTNQMSYSSSSSLDSSSETSAEKTVLVTGGAGFIGGHTAMALLERGDKVVVIDELNDYYDVNMKQDNLQLLHQFKDRFFFIKEIYVMLRSSIRYSYLTI